VSGEDILTHDWSLWHVGHRRPTRVRYGCDFGSGAKRSKARQGKARQVKVQLDWRVMRANIDADT
jgi:hypothetical protein